VSGQSSHYFSPDPQAASRRRQVELSLPDCELRLTTDAGVFSADRVDAGTRLLLQEAPGPTPEMRSICDVGCGYGPIALTLAHRAPTAEVWALDVNERAVGLCAENAAANRLENIRPVLIDADGSPVAGAPQSVLELPDVQFDGIWSNPPIRIGKPALHALLTTWLNRLSPDGRAWLVVQRHLGADSLADWLDQQGWATDRLLSRAGYRLLEVAAR
jgi:16S rRNA (guanine1207-N2)-methyltransferase